MDLFFQVLKLNSLQRICLRASDVMLNFICSYEETHLHLGEFICGCTVPLFLSK